ncbi:helix-turn-helix domain-containing protein, partial [Streptomyces sp. CFMR 7]|uniref:helix-turn-helix domain-containing protein n=1 Tax=Streptomyces sp. CFMR 7 TaxID=1649184 RepID=UPI0037DA14CD
GTVPGANARTRAYPRVVGIEPGGQLAARQPTVLLLNHEPDTRLPRVRDFAEELGCGNGTVQAALQLPEEAGAITMTTRPPPLGPHGPVAAVRARDDHGNDPTIGYAHHIREYVPAPIHHPGEKGVEPLPDADGLADGGTTAAHSPA